MSIFDSIKHGFEKAGNGGLIAEVLEVDESVTAINERRKHG